MTTDDAIRAALAEAYSGRTREAFAAAPEEYRQAWFDDTEPLLPTVRRLMQQQAAEELREAADRSGLMSSEHGKTIPVADLRARAATLAPEPSL